MNTTPRRWRAPRLRPRLARVRAALRLLVGRAVDSPEFTLDWRDMLDEADQLLQLGYFRSSAITTRAAVERCIKDAQTVFSPAKSKDRTLNGRIRGLHAVGAFDIMPPKAISDAILLGHRAAHGGVVTQHKATAFLEFAESFCRNLGDGMERRRAGRGLKKLARKVGNVPKTVAMTPLLLPAPAERSVA